MTNINSGIIIAVPDNQTVTKVAIKDSQWYALLFVLGLMTALLLNRK